MQLFGALFACAGAVFCAIAVYDVFRQLRRRRGRLPVRGTVVANRAEATDDGEYFASVVGFKLPDGRQAEFESHVLSSPPAYKIGAEVPVLYDPADPKAAIIDSFDEQWVGPGIIGFLGLVFTILGFAFVLFA